MKKYAFILMGPHYTPEEHRASFELEGRLTSIFTVRDFAGAREQALQCAREGYGCLELCGAFDEQKTRELIELTGNRVAIGFVTHLPEQDELFAAFFCGKA